MVVHNKGGYAEGPATPRSWLAAIASRVGASSRRARGRRREDYHSIALEAAHARGLPPDKAAELGEQLFHVQEALDVLDLDHRVPLVLFELEGEPCESIAAALNVPTGTVYSRLHSARRKFADAYAALASDGDHTTYEAPKSA